MIVKDIYKNSLTINEMISVLKELSEQGLGYVTIEIDGKPLTKAQLLVTPVEFRCGYSSINLSN